MCPAFQQEVSRNAGQNTGTGLVRAHRERDTVPVPFPVPICPADVPIAELSAWQRAFMTGCQKHIDAGRELTARQVAVLERLRGRGLARARAFGGGA